MLESKDGWDETAWEEQVFTFLETTITEMDALQWTEVLGERFVLQVIIFNKNNILNVY